MSCRSPFLPAAFALWIAAVGWGAVEVLEHQMTPADSGSPTLRWPVGSRILREDGRPTLLMAAHPHCPCTRASLGELAWIMARCRGRITASVLVFRPEGAAQAWADGDILRNAEAIPGVRVLEDEGGRESRRFGASTSGQTLLYDARGRLVFRGGITPSRGHSGGNAGRDAVVSLILRGAADTTRTPTFGCSLAAPAGT